MNSEELSPLNNKPSIIKNLPMPLKILLIIFVGIVAVIFALRVGRFLHCISPGVICEHFPPTMSPEMITTQVASQYKLAIEDINAGRYEIAKQRLEYIVYHDPEYSGAKEKLLEVEKILQLTPTP
jgi:hypothetical protein